MSREDKFLAQWKAEKDIYRAWGKLLSKKVTEALKPLIAPIEVSYFLKSSVQPRLKDDNKLLEKAFYRNKPYKDPYNDITDKVGTRFVVLLGSDITKVVDALQQVPGWTMSKDRDYEEEQKLNPVAFEYAAVHFIVRPDTAIEEDGTVIPAGTPCEVQIKTILQHAYSELTHDTIYKPQIDATPVMQRNAAKAMALLEATNDYFELVAKDVSQALASVRDVTSRLSELYRHVTGLEPKPSLLEGLLVGAYEPHAPDDYMREVTDLLDRKPFLVDRIKERVAGRNPLFTQPSILLAYRAVSQSPEQAILDWPLTPGEIEPLLNDFGESIH